MITARICNQRNGVKTIILRGNKLEQLMSQKGHSRLGWSRPRLVHVRFTSDSDRQPSKRDPALRAITELMRCSKFGIALQRIGDLGDLCAQLVIEVRPAERLP